LFFHIIRRMSDLKTVCKTDFFQRKFHPEAFAHFHADTQTLYVTISDGQEESDFWVNVYVRLEDFDDNTLKSMKKSILELQRKKKRKITELTELELTELEK